MGASSALQASHDIWPEVQLKLQLLPSLEVYSTSSGSVPHVACLAS